MHWYKQYRLLVVSVTQYILKSRGWFSQRLGYIIHNRERPNRERSERGKEPKVLGRGPHAPCGVTALW